MKWTEVEDAKLRALRARGKTAAEIGHAMARTPSAINARVSILRHLGHLETAPVMIESETPSHPAATPEPTVSIFQFPEPKGTPSERLAQTLESLIQGVSTGRLLASRVGTVLELTERYLRVLELNLEAHRIGAGSRVS